MKKIVFLALVLCLLLSACNIENNNGASGNDNKNDEGQNTEVMAEYVGEWFGWEHNMSNDEYYELSLVLNADGSCFYNGMEGRWNASSGNFEVEIIGDAFETMYVFAAKTKEGKDYLILEDVTKEVYRASDYTKLELTMDNWQQYFTLSCGKASVHKNAFGDIESVSVNQYLRIKEEYAVGLRDLKNSPVVEYTYTFGDYQCTVDMENETYVLGELIEQYEESAPLQIQTLGWASVDKDAPSTLVVQQFGGSVEPYPVGTVKGLCVDFQITRIQGAIYLLNE